MLNLSHEPPPDSNDRPFPIQRVLPGRALQAVITTVKPLGCLTHWWGSRTVPCTEPACPACNAGSYFRWHMYLSCFDHKTQLHFLLELTASASAPITEYGRVHGTTRGCGIKCYRIPDVPNGRIHIQTTPTDPTRYPIPQQPDLAKLLSRLWNIPLDEIQTPDSKVIIPEIVVTPEQKLRHANRLRQSVENNGGK
jgi:hypothetical protein